ncbi:similar to Saccharomyces cerevisiae YER183C FAU1 5,10-methenyltetrahydrofolate synthetase, involved in folic acid biosynthesis [Maudiozyma barnettii]|uniref:5-formyltetrahydrofolate cyclo-ligase n=1 Tax=Maudiozyma barnettii TaxID=61262 RepID=A0A8H2VH67_9SACH|nr:5-formyltetrahydrofolate cyclo-ligase [Kazachstania barnettii]CAB4255193.1 similar to Saccharomyces cerevisiae YER183C FAU1 5,10-methenyltetrahydrofolate synthetase, involved in folic acid biosynthesis [Kazachstania barnettii]CAD1783477.1 similar to Saccharomyces cerevisiae YER183C FAU1 5,10-methenyltetrahydrofolate synthetase, involved in folic acid biosynthesis [Kazachstania barnettii]
MSKQLLRTSLRSLLDRVTPDEVARQSVVVTETLKQLVLQKSKDMGRPLNVGCYMGMDHQAEVQTLDLLKWLFGCTEAISQVYLPRCTTTSVTGQVSLRPDRSNHPHLVFLQVSNWSDIVAMKPAGKYKLREPPMPPMTQSSSLIPPHMDLMVVPGVGFAPDTGARIGWGAGYYDDFFQRYLLRHPHLPYLVGVCLKEQITNDIHCEPHDQQMDCLVVGDGSLTPFNVVE